MQESLASLICNRRQKFKDATEWLGGAISPDEAKSRGLVPLTCVEIVTTVEKRLAFFDFWRNGNSAETLVQLDARRFRLFTARVRKPTKRVYSFR